MPMAGRSHGQHAVPATFGYKVAVWVDELIRHVERFRQVAPRLFVAMLGGGAGTYASLGEMGPKVQAERMVREYATALYVPAAVASRHLADADGGFRPARELAAWKQRVVQAWPQLRIEHVEAEAAGQALGSALTVRVSVALGPLTPDDVMVEVVYGRPDDADEIVSPELATAIRKAIAHPAAEVYALDRLSSFCGHWVHHSGWYPDWIPRLFKRGAARFSDDLVHEKLVVSNPQNPIARLEGKLMHYSYDDFEDVLRKLDTYSSAGARQRHAAGKRGSFSIAVVRGAWAFVRTYLLRGGFLDGRAGFMIAVFNAQTVYYRFLKLAQLNQPR